MPGSWRFTDEQNSFAAAVREWCRREVGTKEQRDKYTNDGEESHSPELYRKLAATGYIGVSLPEEYGGSGGGVIEQLLLHEELWYGMAPVHGVGTTHTCAGIYKRFATEDQKHRVLAGMTDGTLYSISISEPGAGSDLSGIACKAEKVDGGWRINGQKTWCSDAHFADWILVTVRTEREENPRKGLSMLEVPAHLDGVDVRPIKTMGGKEVNDIFFTDVFVPDDALVGERGGAWNQLMAGLNGERIVCAAQGLGMAQRTFDDLLAYITVRQQFGQTIGTFQAVRHRVATMALELEAARSLTYEVVYRAHHNIGDPQELVRLTSMAKVKMTETAKALALEGVQLMGGYGYASEYEMERHLRDAISPTIYAGTNEIQREIISSTYGLR
ncbi:MAG TPA: acyl-CoA dehydrogenase family protein [Sporichthya sp.]|nr:acyl-CoA dehydrogenase family protein [Sporichthya sp.]